MVVWYSAAAPGSLHQVDEVEVSNPDEYHIYQQNLISFIDSVTARLGG